MERLRQDLQKKAKVPGAPSEPAPTAAAQSPAVAQSPEGGSSSSTPGAEPGSPPNEPGSTTPTADPAKAGKTNPWKLVDTYKARVSQLEKDIADAKTNALAEQQRKQYLTKIEAAEKRAAELEDHIRFVDYTKSAEFQTKYQLPYEAAWKRATQDLREMTVTNPQTNAQRPATPEDLLALVQMPLGKAREVARTIFGDFADDMMAHRKEIRSLMDTQNEALKEARTKAADREKYLQEQQVKTTTEINHFVADTWNRENDALAKNEKIARFFKVDEGDDEGKASLERGYQIADEAFKANPLDPTLNAEQRTKAVQLHVALRNRAAAFGRLTSMVAKLEAEKAALQKELDGFKGSTPSTGGQPPAAPGAGPASAKESVFAALRAKAKPI